MLAIPLLDLAVGGFRELYLCAADPNFECPY